jgi:hypothetical protein
MILLILASQVARVVGMSAQLQPYFLKKQQTEMKENKMSPLPHPASQASTAVTASTDHFVPLFLGIPPTSPVNPPHCLCPF